MSGKRWPSPAEEAEQEETIYKLWLRDLKPTEIARHTGLTVDQVRTRLDNVRRRQQPDALEQLRQAEADRLSDLRRTAHAVRARRHYVVQGGRIVKDDDGEPLRDDGPVLKANAQLLAISERWARLYGLNAPEQLDIVLARRIDEESADVAEAVMAAVEKITAALDVDGLYRAKLLEYGLQVAAHALHGVEGQDAGPAPEAPKAQLALPPGPSAARPEPAPRYPRAPASDPDAILAAARALLDEEEDDDAE